MPVKRASKRSSKQVRRTSKRVSKRSSKSMKGGAKRSSKRSPRRKVMKGGFMLKLTDGKNNLQYETNNNDSTKTDLDTLVRIARDKFTLDAYKKLNPDLDVHGLAALVTGPAFMDKIKAYKSLTGAQMEKETVKLTPEEFSAFNKLYNMKNR